ncbi:hypothetical protein [Sinorhizobium fredii]|nr:hypothetical protein [Sinorhizobium fredii]
MLVFLLAAPAMAEECKPDIKAADGYFSEAFAAIYNHQGFAWACAPYIGDDLAKSSIVHIEGLLEACGAGRNEAIIQADKVNAKAKDAGESSGTIQKMEAINATRQEAMIACSQLMDEEFQKFRVARAKMLKAECVE